MKHKKLFAILTLVCFMFTLMPVATFANNDSVQQTNLLFEQNMARTTTDSGVKLTTPTGLSWGATPGDVQWTPVEGAKWYNVEVYHGTDRVGNKQLRENVDACKMPVTDMINESGEYRFTVVAHGDGNITSDVSEKSAAYNYTRPIAELAAPSDVAWKNKLPAWQPNNTYENVQYYNMHYYEDRDYAHKIGWHCINSKQNDGYMYDNNPELEERLEASYPDTVISFSVRAVSKNIETIANSDLVYSSNLMHTDDLLHPVDVPTNVKWADKAKGIISWEGPSGMHGYELDVRMSKNDMTVRVGRIQQGNLQPAEDGKYYYPVGNLINASGDYAVYIKSLGDGTTTRDSIYAVSDIFKYDRPSAALAAPESVEWKDKFATWTKVDDANLNNYTVLYSRNEYNVLFDTVAPVANNERDYISHNNNMFAKYGLLKNGGDDYTFTVQANSTNILEVANSVPSARSAELNETVFRGELDAPTGLTWDNAAGEYTISFYPVASTNPNRAYHAKLYRDGQEFFEGDCGYLYDEATGKAIINFTGLVNEYGTYKVEICANGDDGYTTDSNYVTAEFTYKRPSSNSPSGGTSAPSTPSQTTTSTTDSTTGTVTTTVTLSNGSAVSNTDSSVEIEIATVDKKVVKEVEKLVKSDDAVEVVGDEDNTVSISAENKVSGSSQESFAQPVGVSVKVDSKVLKKVNDTSKLTLAKVVTNEDGTTELVYMGGSYDAETGTFNAKVDEAGDYILVEKADLVKIELNIGKKDAKHNDKEHKLDVAPKINEKEGRTELPLRYLGEALGFGIEWNNNVVTVTKDDVSFSLTIGEDIPGYGTPYIDSDRTMVSARYISEKLGANVIWDPIAEQVIVVK